MELAKKALSEEYNIIICIGGDGSLNEVINGVMHSLQNLNDKSRQALRIGLLPKGTGNDFARTMKISPDIIQLKKSIDDDVYQEIDLGNAEFINETGTTETRYFINITNIGIGGVVSQKMGSGSRWMGSFLTYQKAILNTLINYKKQHVKVIADTFGYDGEIMVLAIANGKYFGGGLCIAPEAVATDATFSVVIVGNVSMIEYLKFLGKLKSCKKIDHPGLTYYEASEMGLKSSDPLPIDMDGEFVGYTPLQITNVTKAIKMLT